MKQTRSPGPRTVNCPTCSASIKWTPAEHWRPFCSERCKLIDLGGWLDESNRIPAEDGLSEEPGSVNKLEP
jgi:endogenous inhibitor of DNA gyrase (YacG/DUF329 family)